MNQIDYNIKINNSGSNNSGSYNSGNFNSGNYNSGNCNSGYRNSGSKNSGNDNSGYCNSGDYNSGLFNTDTPMVRCFNKETGIKREDFKFPNMAGFKLTEFKNGKLINYDYKEAWKNFWNSISEDRKQEFMNLPNFDSEIFEEITGIKVETIINKTTVLNIINQISFFEQRILELKTQLDSKEYENIKLEIL